MTSYRHLAVASLLGCTIAIAHAADQTLLGNQLAVKNPSTLPRRQIVAKAKEHLSPNTIVGNPVASGASLTVTANGGSPSSQTYLLPIGSSGFTGKPFWSGDAASGFKYRDVKGENGAVKVAHIRKAGNGTFTLKAVLSGKISTIGVLPPDPGASGCVLLSLAGGDTYSVAFLADDGVVVNKGGALYKHTKVALEGTCAVTTTTTIVTTSTTTSSSTTTVTTTSSTSTTCVLNADGGPDRLVLTVGSAGTDLDLGWTGFFHNFPLVVGGRLELCLSDCDGATDTTCAAQGPIATGGPTFGAPHPLFAANVAVCVVNRWDGPISGTADEATGDISLSGAIFSDVYLTSVSAVCPQCKTGTCDGGANGGMPCTVEATHPVHLSSGTTELYELSSTCTPAGVPVSTLQLEAASLTSGATSPLHGPTPCAGQAQPHACGGAGCGAACTGSACGAMIPDPTDPSQMACLDVRGGISQACCVSDTTKPCFPRDGNDDLVRTGRATVPQPPLPDPSHPKTHVAVLASTFCTPSTSNSLLDSIAGLPGPGTMLLHGTAEWTKP